MGKSLRDQLLEQGLASKQKAREVSARKRKERRTGQGAHTEDPEGIAAARAEAERAHREKIERDRALNRAREERKAAVARRAQLLDVLNAHAQNEERAEIPFHFVLGSRVKRLYVTEGQQAALARNRSAIITFEGRHYLVDADLVERLRGIDPEITVFFASRDDDDPAYAEHPIPEDLIW